MQFGRGCHLWGRDCPFLALVVPCLPLCLWWGDGPVRSWLALLWYSVNPLFCEWARLHLRLELSPESFFFFFLLFLAIPQCGLLSHVSSLRLSSGHSGPVLTLSNAAGASLSSPCLLVADPSVWATSLLGVAIRHIICGFIYLFYLLIMMPAEIPKLPHSPASERISWCLDTSPFL